jgi:histidine triad (HIT) family protein
MFVSLQRSALPAWTASSLAIGKLASRCARKQYLFTCRRPVRCGTPEPSSRRSLRMASSDPAQDCIFCKIISGELPCYKVFSDENCTAFLDLFPATSGHTLLVPRSHHEVLETMPPEEVSAVFARVPLLGKAIKAAVGAPSYNLLVNNGREAGQVVPHVHIHIIPRKPGDGLIRHPGGGPRLEPDKAEPLLRVLKEKLGHAGP